MLPDMMVASVRSGGRDLGTAYATPSMGGTLVAFPWPRPGAAAAPPQPLDVVTRRAAFAAGRRRSSVIWPPATRWPQSGQ